MKPVANEDALLWACEVLFGKSVHLSGEFLEYLQLSNLKRAYRRRAMETHPDRCIDRLNRLDRTDTETFLQVRQAFDVLHCFLQWRERCSLRQTACHPISTVAVSTRHPRDSVGRYDSRSGPGQSTVDTFYSGPMPQRQLLFGHFLYYSGLANWRTITRILIWQRTERPRLGELACRFGMLRNEDIAAIIKNKIPMQPFGQTALRLGLLNEYQLRLLISHQQRLQKKFGTILLEKELISQEELEDLLAQFMAHNTGVNFRHSR